jgi:hypothetical protein
MQVSTSREAVGGEEERGLTLPARTGKIQNCDFSTLAACAAEMTETWVPSKLDQVITNLQHLQCFDLLAAIDVSQTLWFLKL